MLLLLRRVGLCVRAFLVAAVVFSAVGLVLQAKKETTARERFVSGVKKVTVKPPKTLPKPGQEAIEIALSMYGIEVPSSAMHPRYDAELKDRGLTSRAAFAQKAEVTIGPAAFASWGLLGSTLAHELEVHCQQSFLLITVMDAIGLDGTSEAERQAYIHELRQARRFSLPVEDADLIADTMEYYYPEGRQRGPTLAIKSWLARNLLRAQGN